MADDVTFAGTMGTANGVDEAVNWSHVENGRISRIRAVFDPRALLKA